MGSAVKVLLAFRVPCWPTGLWDAVCPGAFLPELWITSYPAAQPGACPPFHYLCVLRSYMYNMSFTV